MESKVLIGRKAICDHLGIGRRLFYELIKEGAPISKGAGGWRSHVDLLDSYFRATIENPEASPISRS
jgi:hypothetical protein